MSEPKTDKPDGEDRWAVLFLVSLGVALVLGIPLGIVVAVLASVIRGDFRGGTYHDWLQWTLWTVPFAVGILTFVMGIPFVKWDASAATKKRTLATAAVWLGCPVFMLVGSPFWFRELLIFALLITSVAVTLLIWRGSDSGNQPPQ